jgi:ubiquinone/menaquinone biosynthesis C-methylase UbiE
MSFLSPRQIVDSMNIKPSSTVLDIGAGSGAYVYEALRVNGKGGRVIALDIDSEKLKLIESTARFGGFVVETLHADAENKIILPDYSVDYIIAANVLHIFEKEKLEFFLKEMYRILAPNGYMTICDWKSTKFGPKDEHIIMQSDLENMLKKVDFSIEKHLPAGEYHYAILCKK